MISMTNISLSSVFFSFSQYLDVRTIDTLLSVFELIPCRGGKKSLVASVLMRQQHNLMILAVLAVLVVFSNVSKPSKLYDVQL